MSEIGSDSGRALRALGSLESMCDNPNGLVRRAFSHEMSTVGLVGRGFSRDIGTLFSIPLAGFRVLCVPALLAGKPAERRVITQTLQLSRREPSR